LKRKAPPVFLEEINKEPSNNQMLNASADLLIPKSSRLITQRPTESNKAQAFFPSENLCQLHIEL
jgi:hypothetical protein